MSKLTTLRNQNAGRYATPKPRKPAYKPAPFNVTAFQKEANRLNIEPKHIVIGRNGGKVPGIPKRNRKPKPTT